MLTNVLSKQEQYIGNKVFKVYNLTEDNFPGENEYNMYLEEREVVFQKFLQNKNDVMAEQMIRSFEKKYTKDIEIRAAHISNLKEIQKTWKIMPLQTQMEAKERKDAMLLMNKAAQQVDYSDTAYLKEVNDRTTYWEPGMGTTVDEAGGSNPEWLLIKSKMELRTSMDRPIFATENDM